MITDYKPFGVVVSVISARGVGVCEDTTDQYFRLGGILHGLEYFVPELALITFRVRLLSRTEGSVLCTREVLSPRWQTRH